MVIWQADGPLLDRYGDAANANLAVLVDPLDQALTTEHERARIRRVGEDLVDRAIARTCPPDPPLPNRSAWQLLPLADQLHQHLSGGPQPPPQAEHPLDRVAHLLIGGQRDAAVVVALEPDRKRQAQLAALGLVAQPTDQSRTDQVQLRLGDLSLEAQQQPVVEILQVIDPVRVGDQRAGQRAQIKQPVPVCRAAREPRGLPRQDQPNVTKADLRDQLGEPQTPVRRGARASQIIIDDRHRRRRPTQLYCPVSKRILQRC
jgi:hypothetical protein